MRELKWSVQDIENMYFWEREVYINILVNYNSDQEQKRIHNEMAAQQFGQQ
jgi:hypothetical protein